MVAEKLGFTTRLVHVGEQPDPATGAVIPPIHQSTTFAFPDNQSMLDLMEGRQSGYIYTRYGNPNYTMVEAKLADLEGGEAALVLATGMAATSTAILSTCRAGDHVITHRDVYGGSFGFFYEVLPSLGMTVSFVDMTNLEEVVEAFRPNTRAVFLESPSNPTLQVADIAAISRIAHDRHAQLIVDNTLATPLNQNPLELGADAVVHSCTKYLNGHSDVMAGAIVSNGGFIERCRNMMRKLGGTLNGFDAWLLLRGMKTLELRMQRHNAGAQRVAEFLSEHAAVERVLYPGLPTHPGYDLACRQMKGFGGLLSVVMRGGGSAAGRLIDRCQLFTRAVSLGSVESLITQPVAAVHFNVPMAEREVAGITEGLVRIAVGIEDPADLISDLEQALG